jgi:hypothetical protein
VEDENEEEPLIDDTDDFIPTPNAVEPPPGYTFEPRPQTMPAISSINGRDVFWLSQLPNGSPLVWIIAEVIGGPIDPAEALLGVTIRLKCNHRKDKNTPDAFRTKISSIVQVALNIENYGSKWFLLRQSTSSSA